MVWKSKKRLQKHHFCMSIFNNLRTAITRQQRKGCQNMQLKKSKMKSTYKHELSRFASLLGPGLASSVSSVSRWLANPSDSNSPASIPTYMRRTSGQHGAMFLRTSKNASSSGSRRNRCCCRSSDPGAVVAVAAIAAGLALVDRDHSHPRPAAYLHNPLASLHSQWVYYPEGCQSCQAGHRIGLLLVSICWAIFSRKNQYLPPY